MNNKEAIKILEDEIAHTQVHLRDRKLHPECIKDLRNYCEALKQSISLLKGKVHFEVIDKQTGKVADTYNIALKEKWAHNLVYCDIEGFALTDDGVLMLLDECGNCAYCPDDRFEIILKGDEDD